MKAFHDISNCYIEGEAPIIFPKNPIILSEQCPLAKIKNKRSEKKFSVNLIIKVFQLKLLIIKKNYTMVLIQLKKGKGKMIKKKKKKD